MAFPSLKKTLCTILLVSALGLGCATSPEEIPQIPLNKKEYPYKTKEFIPDTNIIPIEFPYTNVIPNIPPIPVQLPCPNITTESLPEGFVNENYTAQIKSEGTNLNYSLKNAPDYITIDNNGNISFKPNHIENRKLDVIVSNASCSDEKELDLVVYPYLDQETLIYYDYYRKIFDGNSEYLLVAPTPAKQDFIDTNFAYYDSSIKGMNPALDLQFEKNGTEISPFYNKMRYHLTADSTCKYTGDSGYLFGEDICMFLYEKSLEGSICINLVNPEEKPSDISYTCSYPDYYLNPATIEANGLAVHETGHATATGILTNHLVYPTYQKSLDEQLARSVAFIVSGSGGYGSGSRVYANSFCDLTSTLDPDWQYYTFWNGFCNWHSPDSNIKANFDVANLPKFFQTARDIIDCKYAHLNEPLKSSLNLTEIKCSFDAAVGDNTYDYFCSQSWDCNNDPSSILGYVPPADCGFIVQYYKDNGECVK